MKKVRRIVSAVLVCLLVMAQMPISVSAEGDTIALPISLGGTVYDCTVRLASPVTSSGSTEIPSGGTVCFALEFLGGDSNWYPVRANELQGTPDELVTVGISATEGGSMLGTGVWKTWADPYGDRYFIEYTAVNNTEFDGALKFGAKLQRGALEATAQNANLTVKAGITTVMMPISLGGTVYDCTVRLASPVTSSGSTEIPSGGTVCFALEFLGGDGNWYPVRANELQGVPADYVTVAVNALTGGTMLGTGNWNTWADPYGDRYFIEYAAVNNTEFDEALNFTVTMKRSILSDAPQAANLTVKAGITTVMMPISLGGTVYDCTVRLASPVTSSGTTEIPSGGTVCFPLEFLGGDGNWYPVRANELQGVPADYVTVAVNALTGGTMLGTGVWNTWADPYGDRYFIEYSVNSTYTTVKELKFGVTLKKNTLSDAEKFFDGKVGAGVTQMTAPINIGGVVYECVIDFIGYLTSSGSDTIPSGGTVCFPLMFLGGDGNWYPVLEGELCGTPDLYMYTEGVALVGGDMVGAPRWGVWDNGHYFLEFTFTNTSSENREAELYVFTRSGGISGASDRFVGTVSATGGTAEPENIAAPIKIDGTVYNCFIDFKGYLTSSGNETLMSGGTVCFPLMFLGGDGKWYPVLEGELCGTPADFFTVSYTALGEGYAVSQPRWQTWSNGHYFAEFSVTRTDESERPCNVAINATLYQNGTAGETQSFIGYVNKGPKVPAMDVVPSAALQVNRIFKTENYNSLSFTIAGVTYTDRWPVDFASPNTEDAILKDGSKIKAELRFMVNGNWYPVRENEVNEDINEEFNCEFIVLEGEDCLGTPRLTAKMDQYGDIWEFEIPVQYAGENSNFRFTLCLKSADNTVSGDVYEVSGTVQPNGEFIIDTDPTQPDDDKPSEPVAPAGNKTVIYIAAAVCAVVVVGAIVITVVVKRKKNY